MARLMDCDSKTKQGAVIKCRVGDRASGDRAEWRREAPGSEDV